MSKSVGRLEQHIWNQLRTFLLLLPLIWQYAKANGLLDEECWTYFKPIAKHEHLVIRLVKEAKLRSFRTSPKYNYGFELPRTYIQDLELDRIAGNHLWRDANILEHKKLAEYNIFLDKGKYCKSKIPMDY